MVYRHFAFFSTYTTRWLGEVAGYVPYPDLPATARTPGRRHRLMADWQKAAIRGLGTRHEIVDELWDPAFAAVPSEHTVALDVTSFAWPVGDHIWHRYDPIDQRLDWPESSGHRFIEINTTTLEVVAQQHSHRPVRDAVSGQHVLDITGTPYEQAWGWIWGRFVWRGTRWEFEPRIHRHRGRVDEWRTAPADVRRLLTETPIDLALVRAPDGVWVQREAVA